MKTQSDHLVRVVSLENLRAMCKRVSGTCHRFTVESVSANRVCVSYSNPNEYGSETPVYAYYPAYCDTSDKENPSVVMSATLITGGHKDDYEPEQAFWQLTDCPRLWRDPRDGSWKSDYEIAAEQYPQFVVTSQWDKDGCAQTWLCNGETFTNWQAAQERAVSLAAQARANARDHKTA